MPTKEVFFRDHLLHDFSIFSTLLQVAQEAVFNHEDIIIYDIKQFILLNFDVHSVCIPIKIIMVFSSSKIHLKYTFYERFICIH